MENRLRHNIDNGCGADTTDDQVTTLPRFKRQHRREAGVVLAAAKPPLLLTHCWCYQ
jgi:hypothetical protein